ncbi:hypothetical protein [Allosalinactinospora lopnorensis]|uniref:hypothetical protein n=1 Tax=Allosalinactinospora lopnorensis TaxID=1352348 RepID=UPI000623E78A|nr:hypothetical protein [Allosalinactinospora lopnorensis]
MTLRLSDDEFSLLFQMSKESPNIREYGLGEGPPRAGIETLHELLGFLREIRGYARTRLERVPEVGRSDRVRLVSVAPGSVTLSFRSTMVESVLAGLETVRERLGDAETHTRTGFSPAEVSALVTRLRETR